ncbi:MAG: hypothetical protein U1F11_00965 [Steroidobacteraceae bacterium]
MSLNLNELTEAQLLDLNRRIVERLRFLQQARAHETMLNFAVGERVGFDTSEGHFVSGVLVRYNKKTVTVIADDGHQWNVAPLFLRRVLEPASGPPAR